MFEQGALERVVRCGKAPFGVAEAIGEVRDTEVVHAHITELAGEGKGDRARTSIGWFEVQDDTDIGKFGRQVLILAG